MDVHVNGAAAPALFGMVNVDPERNAISRKPNRLHPRKRQETAHAFRIGRRVFPVFRRGFRQHIESAGADGIVYGFELRHH